MRALAIVAVVLITGCGFNQPTEGGAGSNDPATLADIIARLEAVAVEVEAAADAGDAGALERECFLLCVLQDRADFYGFSFFDSLPPSCPDCGETAAADAATAKPTPDLPMSAPLP